MNIEDYLVIEVDLLNNYEQRRAYTALVNNTPAISKKVNIYEYIREKKTDPEKVYNINRVVKILQYEYELTNGFIPPVMHMTATTYYNILRLIDVMYDCIIDEKINLFGIDIEFVKGYVDNEITVGLSLKREKLF